MALQVKCDRVSQVSSTAPTCGSSQLNNLDTLLVSLGPVVLAHSRAEYLPRLTSFAFCQDLPADGQNFLLLPAHEEMMKLYTTQ